MSRRDELIDRSEQLHRYLMEDFVSEHDLTDEVEDIFLRNGASEDDSDPVEGFYVTMSNAQIQRAIDEMLRLKEENEVREYQIGLTAEEYGLLARALLEFKDRNKRYTSTIYGILGQFDNPLD